MTSLTLPDYFTPHSHTEVLDLEGEFRTYRDRYLQLQAQRNFLEALASGVDESEDEDGGNNDEDQKNSEQLATQRAALDTALKQTETIKRELGRALKKAALERIALETLQGNEREAAREAEVATEATKATEREIMELGWKEEHDKEGAERAVRDVTSLSNTELEARLASQSDQIKALSGKLESQQDNLYAIELKKVPIQNRVEMKRAELAALKKAAESSAESDESRVRRLAEIQRWYAFVNKVLMSLWGIRVVAEDIGTQNSFLVEICSFCSFLMTC